MYIYIVVWMIICLLGIILRHKKKYEKIFIFTAFIIMAIIIGLRGVSVGEDTHMYLSIAKAAQNLSFNDIISGFPKSIWNIDIHGVEYKVETLYLLYNKIIMSITNNSQMILFVTAVITCIGFGKFIYDNSYDKFFSTYVFLCEFFFMASFNIMRQLLAMSIAINSYTYIKNGKNKKALLAIIIASLFHQSSIIYLGLFLLFRVKNIERTIKYILIISIILIQIPPVLYKIVLKFSPYYASYLEVSYWQTSAKGIIILWAIEIIIIMFMCLYKLKNQEEFVIVSCTIFYLIFEIIALKYTAISRVAVYFRVVILLLIPMFQKFFKKSERVYYIFGISAILAILYFKTANSPARLYQFF